jgi:hypothetical protein
MLCDSPFEFFIHLKYFFPYYICSLKMQKGESIVKRARCTKVKVLFQGLHMTHVYFVLVYNFDLYILDTQLIAC